MNNKDLQQEIKMNNFYSKSNDHLNQLIWDSIETADDSLIHSINTKLFDTYRAKLNLLFNLLYSNKPLPIKDKDSVLKFFKIISPLNNEFNMGSYNWNYKFHNGKLFVQNSISKTDLNDNLINNYLNPIKKILDFSNIKFKYWEMKSNRYYKNIDLVYVFDFQE